jgi:hydrocephalus-inducing protein
MRYDNVRCRVEGLGDLRLFVTGECVPQPESDVQIVTFECKVREETSKKITLVKNDTTTTWNLTPVVNSEYWKPAAPTVVVPPGATGECTMIYKPLTMTKASAAAAVTSPAPAAGKKGAPAPAPIASPVKGGTSMEPEDPYRRPTQHEGTVFFALPNGRALLYKLSGVATAPSLGGTVTQSTPAKQNLAFTLPVANWLKTTQRFAVSWGELPASTSLRGAKSFDVPSLATRDYKLLFYAYKPLKVTTTVKFTNESSGEFVTFALEINVTPPGRVDVISLEAVVRQVASHTLTLANPLPDETIVFAPPKCAHKSVRVTQLGDMTGKGEGSFLIEYRPLVPTVSGGSGGDGSEDVELVLHSDQLGDYNYTLKLKGTPPGPEAPLRFQTDFGGHHKLTVRYVVDVGVWIAEMCYVSVACFCRFKHYPMSAGSYAVSVANPECLQVPATVAAPATPALIWDGSEVSFDVVFEPEAVGSLKSELRVSSAEGGLYVWPVFTVCEPARPRGPFTVNRATPINIDIKNVLRDDREFVLTFDNPVFSAGAPTVKIGGKKAAQVAVKYTPAEGAPATGKLIVSCPSVAGFPSWVYYLNGV